MLKITGLQQTTVSCLIVPSRVLSRLQVASQKKMFFFLLNFFQQLNYFHITGFEVCTLLRDPQRLPDEYHSKVEIIQGDVLQLADVKKAIEGKDGVVVALGTRNDLAPTTVMSEGMKNIVTAMKESNVSVVSVCLSGE